MFISVIIFKYFYLLGCFLVDILVKLLKSKLTIFILPAGSQRVEYLPFKYYFGYC